MVDGVFKPGFETQTTAEYALLFSEAFATPLRILDLGTGTGCILISLLKQIPNSTGVGVDINPKAIEIAESNAERHGVADKVNFLLADWADGIDDKFDIVISNPPKIPTDLVPKLVKEVADYDPKEALDGGMDGFYFYRKLAENFRRIAKEDGVGIVQVGQIIADQAISIFQEHKYAEISLRRDYKYSPNCITFRNSEIRPSVFEGMNKFVLQLVGKK